MQPNEPLEKVIEQGFWGAGKEALQGFAAVLSQQIFPNHCGLCQCKSHDLLCTDCRALMRTPPRCQRCALPLPAAAADCPQCRNHHPHFDYSHAVMDYESPFDEAISRFKFGGQQLWAPCFASLLYDSLSTSIASATPDLVIAMPLSGERLKERGFNQSHEIARRLASRLKLPYHANLLTRKPALPQATLARSARLKNVKGVFALRPSTLKRGLLQGAHIAVVDDVMTTGSSLNELARILKQGGARWVSNWVVARTADT